MPAYAEPPFEDAFRADAKDGEVVVTHPGTSVAVSLTPAAARTSARELERAADAAERSEASG